MEAGRTPPLSALRHDRIVEIIQTEVAKFECYEEGEYWELSRDFGARWARMNLEWCENALKTHQRLQARREEER